MPSQLLAVGGDDIGVENCIKLLKWCVYGWTGTHKKSDESRTADSSRSDVARAERGATLVLIGVALTALFVAGALAVDLTAAERRAQQLQDAADASSMAAAKVWAETSSEASARARAFEVIRLNNLPDSVTGDITSKVQVTFPDTSSARVRISDDSSGVFFGGAVGYDPGVARSATSRWSTCSGESCNAGLLRPLEAQNLFPTMEYTSSGISDFTHADPTKDLLNVDTYDIQSINLDNETNLGLVAEYGDNLYFLQHHRRGLFYCFNTVRQGPCWEYKSAYEHGANPLTNNKDAHTQFASKLERIPGTTKFYYLTQAGARHHSHTPTTERTYLRCFDVATAKNWVSQEKRKALLLEGLVAFEPETVSKGRPKGDCTRRTIESDGFYVDYRRFRENEAGRPKQDLRAYGFTERAGGLFSYGDNIYVFVTKAASSECGIMSRHGPGFRDIPPYTYIHSDCDAGHFQRLMCFTESLAPCGQWAAGAGVDIGPLDGVLERLYDKWDRWDGIDWEGNVLNRLDVNKPGEVDKIVHTSQFVTPLIHNNKVYYSTHVIDTETQQDHWYLGCFDLGAKRECFGFAKNVLLHRVPRVSDGGQLHQARMFFYRNSAGTPTAVCSTTNKDAGVEIYGRGSWGGDLHCYDLTGRYDVDAMSAMTGAGWVSEQPNAKSMYRGGGFHYYHPGTNRIYSSFLSTGNTILCYDFTTGTSCPKYTSEQDSKRFAAPQPTPTPVIGATPVPMPSLAYADNPAVSTHVTLDMEPETYNRAHDSRCIYSSGNVGVVWGMEPNGLYGCPYVGSYLRIEPDGNKWPQNYFDFEIGPGTAYKRIRWRLEKPDGTLVATSHPDMGSAPGTDPRATLLDWNAATPNVGWVQPTGKLDMKNVQIGYPHTAPADGDFLVLRVDLELRRKDNGRLPTELWDTGNGPRLAASKSGISITD